jgi:hypothetical protein
MMEKFKYRGGDRTVEDVVKRSKQSGGSYDSYLGPDCTFYKSSEGDHTVRILPPTWDDVEKFGNGWELQIFFHRSVGPDNGTYLCLDKMTGVKCPVCEARRQATDEDEADALKPQWRALAWIIDRDNEKAGPQVLSLPVSLFRDINARSVDKKTNDAILIDDPENGYDVLFSREGIDKRTKYTQVGVDRDPSPIHDDQKLQDRWLKFITEHPLPEMLVYYDEDYINQVLYGKSERRGRTGRDDAEETPARSRPRRGEETEEETTPRRGRGRAAEPEEEDVTPRRRRGVEAAEEPEEDTTSKRRRGAEPEAEEEEERPSSTRSRGKRGGEEEAVEEETATEPTPRRGRAAQAAEPEEEAEPAPRRGRKAEPEEEAEEAPSSQAKRRLERLKPRGS